MEKDFVALDLAVIQKLCNTQQWWGFWQRHSYSLLVRPWPLGMTPREGNLAKVQMHIPSSCVFGKWFYKCFGQGKRYIFGDTTCIDRILKATSIVDSRGPSVYNLIKWKLDQLQCRWQERPLCTYKYLTDSSRSMMECENILLFVQNTIGKKSSSLSI